MSSTSINQSGNEVSVSNHNFKVIFKQNDSGNLTSLLESLSLDPEKAVDEKKESELLTLAQVVGGQEVRLSDKFKSQFREDKFVLIGEGLSESKEWEVRLAYCPKKGKVFSFLRSLTLLKIDSSPVYQNSLNVQFKYSKKSKTLTDEFEGVELPLASDVLGLEIPTEMTKLIKKSHLDSTCTFTVVLKVYKKLSKSLQIHDFPFETVAAILKEMSLGDIRSLVESSPELYQDYRPLLTSIAHSRLAAVIKKYFKSPASFAKVLKSTGTIIGGSSILHVLNPSSTWTPGDLDLIVPAHAQTKLWNYLAKKGYQPSTEKAGYGDYGDQSFLYSHWVKSKGRKIDVCALTSMRPVDHILTYHSSPPMNYYDGKRLVCLFPEYTFTSRLLRNKFTVDRNFTSQDAIAKYILRGYNPPEPIQASPWVDEEGAFTKEEEAELETKEVPIIVESGKKGGNKKIIKFIQDLPKLSAGDEVRSKLAAVLDPMTVFIWGVEKKNLIVEEQVSGKWHLEVEMKDSE